MLRLAIRSLSAHRLRLALSALAIVLGVSFVSGTFIFTDSLGRSFDGLFAQRNPDVLVQPRNETGGGGPTAPTQTLPASLVSTIAGVPGVRAAEGYVGAQGAIVIGADGEPIGGGNPATLGASWVGLADLSPFTLIEGRAPTAATEVVLERRTAELAGVGVGSAIRIITPRGDPATAWQVSGIAEASLAVAASGGTIVIWELATAQELMLEAGRISNVRVAAAPGVSQAALAEAVSAVVPATAEVRTADQVADETSSRLREALGFINTFLLVFALIALFVSAFLIFNTFSMIIAQRTRELALLRAVGASAAQVRRSVIAEALVVSAVASAVGLALGLGLAMGLRALFGAFGATLPGGVLVVEPRTVIATFAVGIVVTVAAAWLPARRAGAVAPVAAMRVDASPPPRALRARAIWGGVLIGGAIALAVLSWPAPDDSTRAAQMVGLSAFVGLTGAIVMSPVVAGPVVRLIGSPIRTTIGRLATGNAVRNPRRTAATSSALMIGVALMSALGVLASSATASINSVIDRTIGADLVVFGTSFRPFPPAVALAVEGTPGVAVASPVRQSVVLDGNGNRALVNGVDPRTLPDVLTVAFAEGGVEAVVDDGAVAVDTELARANGYALGMAITVTAPDGPRQLNITGIYEPTGFISGFLSSVPTATTLGAPPLDSSVFVKVAPGADPASVRAGIQAAVADYPTVRIQDQAQFKADISGRVTQVLGFLFALLALAVLIAFLGIVNTLLLSVVERTREVGLLRAVGATRAQVRRMVVAESALIAIFGALIGVGLGVAYGALLRRALQPQGFDVLAIPTGQLVLFVAGAAAGGVIAALWPARRAARLDVLAAIASG